ncbi:MAG: zinc ribbon domain-containing protein [Nitrospinota bacterium]|nr:MAG: zinc ribbon domain-containing protein [Nitrospinota bacterium]
MPSYEFECVDCKKSFAVVLSIKEREKGGVQCPHCSGKNVKPLITPFQVKTSKKS